MNIEDVISQITDQWMAVEGVNGIAQGKADGRDCVLVFVDKKTQVIEESIPLEWMGFPVKVMEVGDIDAQQERLE